MKKIIKVICITLAFVMTVLSTPISAESDLALDSDTIETEELDVFKKPIEHEMESGFSTTNQWKENLKNTNPSSDKEALTHKVIQEKMKQHGITGL